MVMKDVATVVCWVKEASITTLSSSGLYLLHRVLQGIKSSIHCVKTSIYVAIQCIKFFIQNVIIHSTEPFTDIVIQCI